MGSSSAGGVTDAKPRDRKTKVNTTLHWTHFCEWNRWRQTAWQENFTICLTQLTLPLLPVWVCILFQFSSGWYLCAQKSPYVLHPVSPKFPQCCNVRLIDDGSPSWTPSFQGRLSSASSFHTSLLQAIDGVMSLALCLQVVSQAPQHLRFSEKQAACEGCCARLPTCLVASLHSGMSRAVQPQEFSKVGVDQWHIHRSFQKWVSTVDTFTGVFKGGCWPVTRSQEF